MLSSLDYIIIAIYFVILLLMGYFSSRNESSEEYMIAGRDVDTFSAMATIGSSVVGAGVLLAYTSLAVLYGAGALWLFLGNIAGFVLFYFFAKHIKPLADEHKFYTLPDYFYHRFGNSAGRLSALLTVFLGLGWIVVNFIGGGKTISSFTSISFDHSTIIVGLVIALYLMAGGFKAVVKTDTLQFFGIWSLLLLMVYLLLKYSVTLSLADLNIFNLPAAQIIVLFIAGIIIPIASPELWQRIYAVKDEKVLKKSVVGTSIFMILVGIVLLLISLIIRKQIPSIDPSTALPEGFAKLLPQGWAGLAVVVFYSSIMSSADTYLFSTNASLTQDVLFRDKSNELKVKYAKIFVVILSATSVIFAIFIKDVLDATYILMALMLALGILVVYTWLNKISDKRTFSIALISAFLSVLIGVVLVGVSDVLVVFSAGGTLMGLLIGRLLYPKNKITSQSK